VAFPTSRGRFYEYEDFGMAAALGRHNDQGWNKIYSGDGNHGESWYNRASSANDRAMRHNQYERYVVDEVAPFIRSQNPNGFLIATGCSFGAYHAVNMAFKNPWTFNRVLAISGQYDLNFLLLGDFDQDCYFNSPMAYVPNLADDNFLTPLRQHLQIILCVGGWNDICHAGTQAFAAVLRSREIPHQLDVWDQAWHDWPWWREMTLKHI
jgi:esterase/lipase superfamily enzyme